MIPRGYLSPTCGECGRTFDLLNADDAAEWAYGHDCEAPEANTCDGCGKDYPHALTTWQGHAGQGEYCAACLPVAREGNPLTLPRDTCTHCNGERFVDYGATCEEPCQLCNGTGKEPA